MGKPSRIYPAPYRPSLMRPDSLVRLWRYINHLLTDLQFTQVNSAFHPSGCLAGVRPKAGRVHLCRVESNTV